MQAQLELRYERPHKADEFLEQAQVHLAKRDPNARFLVDTSALANAFNNQGEQMLPSNLPNYTGKYLIEKR